MGQDVMWFTNRRGTTGIARVASQFGKGYRFYISHVDGNDEPADVLEITEWGSSVDAEDLIRFLKGE